MVMPTLYQNDCRACLLNRRAISFCLAMRNGDEPERMAGFRPTRAIMVDKGLQSSQSRAESANKAYESKEQAVIDWL